MVARQQIDRNTDGAHGFQRLTDHSRRQLIVLEDITGDHDELGTDLLGERAETGHRIPAGGGVPGLGFTFEEMPRHPELPVGGMNESHSATAFLSLSGPVLSGIGSVEPGADKSGDLHRHVHDWLTVVQVSDEPRTLILLRHAKSDYPDGVADHDRPLAPRGQREASLAGDWLRTDSLIQPRVQAVLCSSATRTRETLARTGLNAEIRFVDRIYDATPGAVIDEINDAEDTFGFDVRTLLVIGHEPAMSALALSLADITASNTDAVEAISTKYPTSAMAVLRITGTWRSVQLGSAELVAFHVPRQSAG
jgi:phosphohistidine phosphatase